jgi:hypothetical protein
MKTWETVLLLQWWTRRYRIASGIFRSSLRTGRAPETGYLLDGASFNREMWKTGCTVDDGGVGVRNGGPNTNE